MSKDYSVRILRDGQHQYSYTVTTPDSKIAVREGGFFKRHAAVAQAVASVQDLKAFQEGK
jgi:hypothetical protein